MKSDFYNRNLFRAYPLRLGATVPNDLIVDFGCWFLGVNNVGENRSFYLRYIRRVGTTIEFVFNNDTAEADDKYLIFTFSTTDSKYKTVFAVDSAITESEVTNAGIASLVHSRDTSVCGQQALFEGYLVLGDPAAVAALLDEVESAGLALVELAEGTCPVELSTIVNESAFQLQVVGVANKDRTRYLQPTSCREPCWDHAIADNYVVDSCVNGELIFADGYNVSVSQISDTNTILFTAAVGSGLGQQSVDVPLFTGEAPPNGFTTLSGGYRCCEVVRSINGTGGPIFQLKEGDGVRITTYPNLNRIVVDMNFHDLAACPELPSPENVECIPPSADPCECGPENMDDFECPPDVNEATSTDEPPSTIEEPSSNEPGSGSWIVVVCNSNNVTDDNFEVRLNDNVLGTADLFVPFGSIGSCKGVIFATDPTVPASVYDLFEGYDYSDENTPPAPSVCVCNDVPVVPFNIEFFNTGENSVFLRNILDNRQNNYGRLLVAKIVKQDGLWHLVRIELNAIYDQAPGRDITKYFDHEW